MTVLTGRGEAPAHGERPGPVIAQGLPDPDLCVRCGACLPVCPTYAATGLERESPRGRTQLIRAVGEGRLRPDDDFVTQMYDCLDCCACQSACPVGVPIGSLVLAARAAAWAPSADGRRARRPVARLGRWLLGRGLFAHPRRLEWPVFLAGAVYQRGILQRLVRRSGGLRLLPLLWRLESWLPVVRGRPWRWCFAGAGARVEPKGPARMRAAYFLGCFMNTVFAEASVASSEVLRRNGVEVIAPLGVRCCGAPQLDLGDVQLAREFARANIAILEAVDAPVIYSDCAACSGMLKHYGELLHDDADWAQRAASVGDRTRDFSELMLELIGDGPPLGRLEATATWHDPCHLAHLQGVRSAPRELLGRIPGLRFEEMPSADRCCGSAGTYSFRRWDQSMTMLDAKIADAVSTGADFVVTANPGCLGQLELGFRRQGVPLPVRHLSQVLLDAYESGVEGRS